MPAEDRSIAELFAELARDTSTLMRKEIELAKAEVGRNVSAMGTSVVSLIVGGLVALLGVQALVAMAILLLAKWLEAWIAALVVGVVLTLIGGAMAMTSAKRLKLSNLAPRRTLETLKDDKDWAKEQVR
jgi:xanthine/uracil permease